MGREKDKTIYTIGHSTRTIEEFIALLQIYQIGLVADIRNYPGSKRYPHFNKEALEVSLIENGIKYLHLKELGGRRKPKPDSVNTAWRNEAFKGYADYMETDEFKLGVELLQKVAKEHRSAYMCSEAVWWRCHRSLVSDYLKIRDWKVMHILSTTKANEHPFTSAATVNNGKLSYEGGQKKLDL